ncbi:CPXCG motif-containing cysteine-rich protein [Aestuariibacter salexigens]|uniref:CPXCG motif-containing cysteine-rich protein n=1 Tax=Aestuariibacter salexigens TaxID=226010 RepID=UPI0003FC6186|nr:CPXCG motif-containing cysteine-rich protein [Aestuariibacter salexigens]
MSLTSAARFECPYCMTINDIDVDETNDINQQQITDCQICCQPIEITIFEQMGELVIQAEREND